MSIISFIILISSCNLGGAELKFTCLIWRAVCWMRGNSTPRMRGLLVSPRMRGLFVGHPLFMGVLKKGLRALFLWSCTLPLTLPLKTSPRPFWCVLRGFMPKTVAPSSFEKQIGDHQKQS